MEKGCSCIISGRLMTWEYLKYHQKACSHEIPLQISRPTNLEHYPKKCRHLYNHTITAELVVEVFWCGGFWFGGGGGLVLGLGSFFGCSFSFVPFYIKIFDNFNSSVLLLLFSQLFKNFLCPLPLLMFFLFRLIVLHSLGNQCHLLRTAVC